MSAAVAATSPPLQPHAAARAVGLRYVTDDEPGLTRVRHGAGFRYVDEAQRPVREKDTLARIKRLAIPPAWTDVWICADEDGHIQATGRDARGRKQYRYHARFREMREETKYHRMLAFGKALPAIRAHVDRDLARPGLPREKVLATIVALLDRTHMRVGNHEYRRQNGSHGLTTLRDHHAEVRGHTVIFSFRGKHGKKHVIELEDPQLARIVKRCQDLPGQELFQYVDEAGAVRDVGSADVNAYLRDASGEDFTAKDFRTWAGTMLAALALRDVRTYETKAEAKKNVVGAIEKVAQRLGNTPAICRKCYVHPEVLNAYLDGTFVKLMRRRAAKAQREALDPDEAAVLALLRRRLAMADDPRAMERALAESVRRARKGTGGRAAAGSPQRGRTIRRPSGAR